MLTEIAAREQESIFEEEAPSFAADVYRIHICMHMIG